MKESVSIPLAVKIGPYFSAMANMAKRLVEAGADGLVLFNRFLQPDIDLETLETRPRLVLSTPFELLAAAALDRHPARPRRCLAGPDQRHPRRRRHDQGPAGRGRRGHGRLDALRGRRRADRQASSTACGSGWRRSEYESVEQLKGSMSQQNCPDPAAFERGNYMKALTCYTGKFI